MNPLLRPLDVGWTLVRGLIAPPVQAVSEWLTGVGRALLGPREVYDVVGPGPGGSYNVVSAHPSMREALLVLESLSATRDDLSVMLDVDVQRHNREAAMQIYKAATASTYCGPDAERVTLPVEGGTPLPRRAPGDTLRPSHMPHGGEDDAPGNLT
jgi:hypothetical protein